ncbi:phosphate transporter PHO1-2-like [Dioscorea cayenensis subsp. rotundata]|uniref:Phosphate transporter PHO1-2-like n=1 Tax=Dioscorea cayennensis subsp. rotundata TaxID=55577 RepID=A0AB40C8D9_DIOCR|nr:phosphate transporter PHO1-2-like [Dioscorea cayenensis subsp. rotundata]
MVKFSRELEGQLIPEWKDKFVNYRQLKKLVKKIKLSALQSPATPSSDGHSFMGFFSFRLLGPCFRPSNHPTAQEDEESLAEIELVHSGQNEVKKFFERLEEEREKVNNFYITKEAEFCERGEILNKQLEILLDLKRVLHEHTRRRRSSRSFDGVSFSRLTPSSSFSESAAESETPAEEDGSPVGDEMVAVLEKNGVSFIGAPRAKTKKGGKPRAASMRIDIPATTPGRTISAVTSMIWEDLINGQKKEGSCGDYISRKKIQCAEKMIRGAFVELHKGLGLLKTYRSLNMVAFRKIVKKFDKVSNQQASQRYLETVKGSHFIISDKAVRLEDEVESIFIKHFANNDRKKAMKFLKPQQRKNSHTITFFVGLFTGSFVTLFSVYAILAHLSGIFSSTESSYLRTVYPVFSMFALLSLHIFLYGCNLSMWRSSRINHNFIFEFNPNTALKHRDAFLICTCFMTMVVAAMVIHLLLRSTGVFPPHVDAIPGILLLLFTGILICPFNICYRSTRYSFLRVMRNIACSPLYSVLMVDFFMADQLTSQIPLLRHLEFTTCYFMAEGLKTHNYDTCTRSQQYKLVAYIISFLPYYWRAMQCARRYIEEGYDMNHLANAGKYMSAMLAAAIRWKYAAAPTPSLLATVIISSSMATVYQLYWDFVKDWGLFKLTSKNFLLRDELILQNKSIYYVSMMFNFVLRLAWVESVLKLNLGPVENRMVDFLLASLEVIRRGHWNFYRLENEHLNNVGKFRAVKTVPLPFREIESDG